MEKKLRELKNRFFSELKTVRDDDFLAELKIKYLGRKGELASILRGVKDLAVEEKPRVGQLANEIKKELLEVFGRTEAIIKKSAIRPRNFDSSLPGQRREIGHLHPSTIVQEEIEEAFAKLGFSIFDGPQLESDYYNFTALNIPEDHPARDTQDTFWVEGKNLLRTHTSNLQVRMLEKYGAPFRGIFPGRVFRYESTDASHEHTFYQTEGLMVDRNINIGNLIAVMQSLLSAVFHKKVNVRLRPGFFPFVEPGFEMDIECFICEGDGCSVCKQSGWVELMPCGLVHPGVLKAGGLDPEEYSGFAFGLGLTRLVMMKYRINDIRLLQSGDLRFLKQF
ncbi:MAG: phenylalanine--tRNA ligase subunit alpha [Candidatus Komeilibacteria bacterium CG11_big_fil_rev_8_21_14_0_20_36_20]|uniref:Phenylalanine--tRNA ligase alpha subunit n=1 Tax=Candidatus Komeilibacteria bacterium CG11_big_fil_rev_8_21_14_0_20_36_20 TaxID=1974477 RepID=A0A2H0NDW4_9BACT|nr:MAG: phenylalanine--tRNA ligase subunit alpha [Candidatus Komeilibacteria bacterium CG11_big_fil_rev_8_21_14_0_20_36_20]PIR81221.1 MAG: phenylalanine--tRNA ligase subunit alpha [Candidatus Komeilibacteria bacterium CG10_big_fil_rev_8_21_14_0_10_36_65]PJC55185.1 MAG: phenylalanine--tRNA ligase subunit alpha [Candidatus Komeilibacteria bacterium CG_4_9_14_0_2_um_filter_36_13]